MQIVLPSEIRVWLKFAIGESVREFAARVEMSPQYIYAVLRGEKEPSPLLLERAGLEVVYRVKTGARVGRGVAARTVTLRKLPGSSNLAGSSRGEGIALNGKGAPAGPRSKRVPAGKGR